MNNPGSLLLEMELYDEARPVVEESLSDELASEIGAASQTDPARTVTAIHVT